MTIDPRTDPHAHIVVNTLPSKRTANKGMSSKEATGKEASSNETPSSEALNKGISIKGKKNTRKKSNANPKGNNPFLRAENEDDDGYDPYSDRPSESEPLFQRDPWN